MGEEGEEHATKKNNKMPESLDRSEQLSFSAGVPLGTVHAYK